MKSFYLSWTVLLGLLLSGTSHAFTLGSSNVKGGWQTRELFFDVNETSCSALGISIPDLNEAIDAALGLWNSASTSSLKLKRGSVVTSTGVASTPVIYCDTSVFSPDFVAGVGSFTMTGNNPEKGGVEINGDSTKNAYFGKLNATYKAILLAHEIGHVLGLGHSEKQYALMYYDISSKKNLTLSQDDVDGISWLNPSDEPNNKAFGCGSLQNTSSDRKPTSFRDDVKSFLSLFLILAFAFLVSRPKALRQIPSR